jgi:hypothetical protein
MAKGKSNGVRRGFIGYASYMFKEKDPAIDELRTVIQTEHGDINRKVLKKIHEEGGPSDATLYAWFFGDTKTPRSAGIEATGRTMGYRREWVKLSRRPRAVVG